ncbi:MAG: glycosyltransferase family 9 protein [Phycisphaerae bacterium]
MPDSPATILVILPTWVGDYVMATPLLRTLRSHFPESRMIYFHEPNLTDLITGCPWPDHCIPLTPKNQRHMWHRSFRAIIGQLRREKIDLAVLLPNSFRAAMTAYLGGARQRLGYDRDGRRWLLTQKVPVMNRRARNGDWQRPTTNIDTPNPIWTPTDFARRVAPALPVKPGRYVPMRMVDYYAGLAAAIGAPHPGQQFELHTTPQWDESIEDKLRAAGVDRNKKRIVLSPGARFGASKCWAPEKFAATADYLKNKYDAEILITCGPGEEPIAQAIGNTMQTQGHVLDEPRPSLGELKSLIKSCDLLLCNDAGPRHFAKAFGKPVVTLYGPTHPEWTATDYDQERIVRIDVDCGPCQQRICPLEHHRCMTDLTVEMACQTVDELLQIAEKANPEKR